MSYTGPVDDQMRMRGRAVAIATKAHHGQTDKQGVLYITHVMAVTAAVPDDCKIVAALHDVVEDTTIGIPDLEAEGFDQDDVGAVKLLTRPYGGCTYEEYIERIADAEGEPGRKARIVKLADLAHNLSRMPPATKVTAGTNLIALERRYHKAEARLRLAQTRHGEQG